jgi:hypothetical protein
MEVDLSSLGTFSTAMAAMFSKLGVPIKTAVPPVVCLFAPNSHRRCTSEVSCKGKIRACNQSTASSKPSGLLPMMDIGQLGQLQTIMHARSSAIGWASARQMQVDRQNSRHVALVSSRSCSPHFLSWTDMLYCATLCRCLKRRTQATLRRHLCDLGRPSPIGWRRPAASITL